MEPEGINVVEIDLNLPDTFYYLSWTPDGAGNPVCLEAVRSTGITLDWKIRACAREAITAKFHLLFNTTTGNLDRGLSLLLDRARRYRVHLVQPKAADRIAARIAEIQGSNDHLSAGVELPEIHYNLFIGERQWADKVLFQLTRNAHGISDSATPRRSLMEICRGAATRYEAVSRAYRSGGFTLKDIAEHFDMHFSEVSTIVNGSTPLAGDMEPRSPATGPCRD